MSDKNASLNSNCPLRADAARRLSNILNADYFRALCEPVRVALVVQLVRLGRSDVTALAEGMPQDRSVISRHLQVLERAGIVSSQQEGRHIFYQIEGASIVLTFAAMLDELREMQALTDAETQTQTKGGTKDRGYK